jgi:phosphate-selective porin OprO/OprP
MQRMFYEAEGFGGPYLGRFHRLPRLIAVLRLGDRFMARGIWPLWTAAVKVVLLAAMTSGLILAQGLPNYQYMDPAYLVATEKSPQPVQTHDDALAQRVAELEKALGTLQAKEEAAAKKAASKMSVNVSGRILLDSVFFGQSEGSIARFGDADDTTQFRQARLAVSGEGFDIFTYKLEVDFACRDRNGDQQTNFKDAYLGIKDLPWLGYVQIGHFKEPFGLELLTSVRNLTFMERANLEAILPGRNVGIAAYQVSENERMTFAFGGFRTICEGPPYIADDDGGYSFTARVTYLPWYDEATQGRGLLHLGLGYSFRDVDDPSQRIRVRPEVNVGPYVINTGFFGDVANYQLLGPEIAFLYGPFSVQSEYVVAFYNRGGADDPAFHGAYVQTSYFLTGENRVYDRKKGVFERVKPFENFFRVRTCDGNVETGWGAWELAYRYSWLDLDDAGVWGGTTADHTFGINWYWNPYMRMMFNYVHAQVSPPNNQPNADLNVFQVRAQVDF